MIQIEMYDPRDGSTKTLRFAGEASAKSFERRAWFAGCECKRVPYTIPESLMAQLYEIAKATKRLNK